MSLKTRLRIAIVALTTAVVIALSLLYLHGFLAASFDRTVNIAQSITGGVQAATTERLNARLKAEPNPPPTIDGIKRYFVETVESDPSVAAMLKRALGNWPQIAEVFIADESGTIRASSAPEHVGQRAQQSINFEEWKTRSLLGNFRQVFWQREDTEFVRTIGIRNDPILTVHVVISSVFVRRELSPELANLGVVSLSSLLIAAALALALPTLVLDPLERLGRRIEGMTTGSYAVPVRFKETKEFAAVHNKLNALGEQVEVARRDFSALRSNVGHLLEQLQEAVLLFDASGRLSMAGKPAQRFLGADPDTLLGRPSGDLFPPTTPIGALIAQAIERRDAIRDRLVMISTNGAERHVIASIEPLVRQPLPGTITPPRPAQSLGILVTLRDAETRGRLEEQLDVADRLTALGQLTRGVAHEIKNPLNAITLHLEVLRTRLGSESPEIDVISREIARLNRIVKTFLDFHRPVDLRIRRLDLNELVAELARLVEPDAAERNVRVNCMTCEGQLWADGDRDRVQQAILNVVMNGIEAMEDGGTLSMLTSRSGHICRIDIADTGPGISPDDLDKIFNLYFTTKEQGSGIGLAMSYRLVQVHNGRLTVASEPGKGAVFSFEFPEASSETYSQPVEHSQIQRAAR